jgi:hypothetical protein
MSNKDVSHAKKIERRLSSEAGKDWSDGVGLPGMLYKASVIAGRTSIESG